MKFDYMRRRRGVKEKTYIAIDLKSFYASVECRERGLDPLDTNLVVADESRTEKTICLAVTPSLKSLGISGRARLFEVLQKVRYANALRLRRAPGKKFSGRSCSLSELNSNPSLEIDFLTAPPRMAYYIKYSAEIFEIYMKYVAPEDIIVYSIDEVFMDVTDYLGPLKLSPAELAMKIITEVLETTGITATAGIGPTLFLCKAAMDIVAKRMPSDKNGVRITELDEMSYRKKLWAHEPLTDFWQIGPGYSRKLRENGMFTMGDVARQSVKDEDLLYKLFGKNAELLIDHAWGYEPVTVDAVKAYKPKSSSICSGQVLHVPYEAEKARLVLKEMAEALSLELVSRGLVTDQLAVTVGYDIENIKDPARRALYKGELALDPYGRQKPKHSRGSENLSFYSSSTMEIRAAAALFDRITDKTLLIRRLNITAAHLIPETALADMEKPFGQLDLFSDYAAEEAENKKHKDELARERRMQDTMISIKRRFGKNAILKGMNLEEGATARDRNSQIGGHKA